LTEYLWIGGLDYVEDELNTIEEKEIENDKCDEMNPNK